MLFIPDLFMFSKIYIDKNLNQTLGIYFKFCPILNHVLMSINFLLLNFQYL